MLQIRGHDAAHERQVSLSARNRAAAAPRVLDLQVHRHVRVPPLEPLCAQHTAF